MIELPEAITLAKQINDNLVGKSVVSVLPPIKEHKFCWFNGNPNDYDNVLKNAKITFAEAFGIYVEINFDNGFKLCINDGVNIRFQVNNQLPKNYQLAILFQDNTALVFTVAMYGGINLHNGNYNNEYYLKSRQAISPFSKIFRSYYNQTLRESKPTLSIKALLATEQRFPGIGNGTLQDILLYAKIHPKRKLESLSDNEKDRLFDNIVSVLKDISANGGRDTEKDLYGNNGGYQSKLSRLTYGSGCPNCNGFIVKENYLGGAIYFCPHCQSLN